MKTYPRSDSMVIRHEFDEFRLNSGLGFNTPRMLSSCSGLLNNYGTPPNVIYGNLNKNLIKKITYNSMYGLKEYDHQ